MSAAARSASPYICGILPARARKSPQIGRCCRCIDVAPTALPFNIKSATVGEGQTPVTLSCVEDDGLGEELRVLLAHSMRMGITLPRPGGMTRLDPVR